jgi:hypothetical protein
LDHDNLDDDCEENDGQESAVSEDTRENVDLALEQFSSIDLIENLHENEHLEDEGIVKSLLSGNIVQILMAPWINFIGSSLDGSIKGNSFIVAFICV